MMGVSSVESSGRSGFEKAGSEKTLGAQNFRPSIAQHSGDSVPNFTLGRAISSEPCGDNSAFPDSDGGLFTHQDTHTVLSVFESGSPLDLYLCEHFLSSRSPAVEVKSSSLKLHQKLGHLSIPGIVVDCDECSRAKGKKIFTQGG